MPWDIIENGKGWYCVVKETTGETVPGGCHQIKADAEDHKFALEMSERAALAVPALRSAPPVVTRRIGLEPNSDRIKGYIAVWGSLDQRDCWDTWFDRARPPVLGLLYDEGALVPIRMMYEHNEEGALHATVVARVTDLWADEVGIAYRGTLEPGPHKAQVRAEIERGELYISTASAEHLARWDEDGRFAEWILSEITLTHDPCEPRMPNTTLSVPTKRTEATRGNPGDCGCSAAEGAFTRTSEMKDKRTMLTLEELGLAPTATLEDVVAALVDKLGQDAAMAMLQSVAMPAPAPDAAPEGEATYAEPEDENKMAEGRSMSVADLLQKFGLTRAAPPQDEAAQLRAENVRLRAEMERRMTAPPPPQPETVRSDRARQPQVSVSEPRRYWPLNYQDLCFGYQIMRNRGLKPSDEFMRMLGGKAATAVEKNDRWMADPTVRSLLPSVVRANEVAISTAAGGGDEWVAIAWSTMIWEKARNARIFQEVQARGMIVEEVPQGSESIYVLMEDADPTVYTIAQRADLAASGRPDVNIGATRVGTNRQLLTPGELGMAVVYSDVFEEDSLIPVLSQYNKQMQEKAEETVEQLFINGDTATGANTNINLIDGTPGTGLSTPYYIASDGALKYALVTGSSTSRDGGALDENDYRLTMKLMPSAIRTRKKQQVFIIDSDAHSASLDIAAVKTEDVRRTNATIQSGVLTNIWGVDVLESGFMPLANNVGKVPAAGGTLGRILDVYAPYWVAGWKRRMRIETDRDILSGDNIIVAKFRLGFKARGAGAATVTYNLTV